MFCPKYIIIYFNTWAPLQGPYDLSGSPQRYGWALGRIATRVAPKDGRGSGELSLFRRNEQNGTSERTYLTGTRPFGRGAIGGACLRRKNADAVGGEIHTVHVLRVLRSDAREPTKLRFPQLLRERRPPPPPTPPPFHHRSTVTTTSPPPTPPPTPFFVVVVVAAAVAVVRSPTASHYSQ